MAFLRKPFGPSKQQIWQQLSTEIGGEHLAGGFWKGDKIHVTHGDWTLTLDTYTETDGEATYEYTRMRAPYLNKDGFRFTIYRRGFFSNIAKWFGMQDVEIGDEEFDRDFIIKGNDEQKLRVLFGNRRIRELILAQPTIYLTIRDDEGWFGATFPEGVDELYFVVSGVIQDVGRLKLLFDLFAETLDQLCRTGSAYEDDPKFAL